MDPRQARESCDNCRTKKLRCSGEHPICSRCSSRNHECTYSRRLQMGRPRTRRVSRQQISQPKPTAPATPSPSAHSSLTGPTTSHGQGISLLSPVGGESTLQGPIPRPIDIASEITSEAPYLDDFYHLNTQPQNQFQPPAFLPNPSSPGQTDKCACPSVLYLLLEQLRNKTTWVVPDDLLILRNCRDKALGVATCDQCPLRYFSVIQNGLILGVVTTCIAECYARLLEQIDQEELQATSKRQRKHLDISNNHLVGQSSSGSPSAQPTFTIEITPSEWRDSMRKIIKSEIHGVEAQRGNCFMTFVLQLEERQRNWHQSPPARDCPSYYRSSCNHPDRVPSCLAVLDDTKRLINSFHL
ncbi:hypothetical protein P170DRAFT_488779 [Aspergillus steynii IBT 23096]|uniref:Zn(2)-C6 fungal-type domain-containing protein n=1 Tax=Aspergillus steynii IBT 23096 TaxID=1392250 RepID=A0A2I2GH86_9EURO|nr:uncharacterized protein P170DRAFT_488779 [Aspergillus steynii IBT 23096]PLB52236.1 hypothetical protein P170DRAFT_488779 [Aspergillus steynii IBT 23096]